MTQKAPERIWVGISPRGDLVMDSQGGILTGLDMVAYRRDDIAQAAARHLAPGDDLVAQATAALEGVTDGPWHLDGIAIANPSKPHGYPIDVCIMGEPANYPGDIPVMMQNWEANARFIAFTRQWVPEAAARIAALTATVAELQAEAAATDDLMGADDGRIAALEADNATLRDRLARMDGVLQLRDEIAALEKLCDHDCDNEDCVRCFHYPEILEQKRNQLAALTDGGTE